MAKTASISWSGPLAPYASGFRDELSRLGYAERTIASLLGLSGQLSRWLEGRRLGVDVLTVSVAEEFLRSCGDSRAWRPTVRTLAVLLTYLHEAGATDTAPSPPVDAPTAASMICVRFRGYLASERGLAGGTVDNYVGVAELFVAQVPQVDGEPQLAGLSARDVVEFVTGEVSCRSVGSAKNLITGLRSFLGWLHLQGATIFGLAQAVPSVAGWSGDALPRALSQTQVKSLLAACDHRRRTGRRDYAVMLLMVRLGLRAGEVAGLQLDDIDWRSGQIVVRGKGNRSERLPLPSDVGEAVAAYLQTGRPTSTSRTVFLRANAPIRGLTAAGLADVVRTAGRRAGVADANAHRLRHTAATEMLRSGGSLPEVALVLRHRSTASTARYAKVDQTALRDLARPWPRETR
ncbi:Site-specific recombinase XerD [Brevibacterium sp. Mu109]|uniref:site-specific integrase n=1 Tax=Brevibacterium sp. Mu109 TaxID=1255669 RepID=UPI000C3F8269|nr:site-specific integrase [Brevibacterium sp. Mu109]SMX95392.1 Site-specific recombinase XerD [Brevibacterium sp. Mu109]